MCKNCPTNLSLEDDLDLPESDDLDALLIAPLRPGVSELPALVPAGFEGKCPKCHGTGIYRSGRFMGNCFKCKGKGKLVYKTSSETRARNKANATVRMEKTSRQKLEAFREIHPDVFAWFDGSIFPFAVAMREAVEKYGHLTERQLAAAVGSAQKLAAAKTQSAARIENAVTVDLTKITEALSRAAQKMGRPKLRAAGLVISIASSTSANAGSYYVKTRGDVYLGKIVNGKFLRSRECTDENETKFLKVAVDPKAAAIALVAKPPSER